MGLVRKTEKLKNEINKQIDTRCETKFAAIIKSTKLEQACEDFVRIATYDGMLYPKELIPHVEALNDPRMQKTFCTANNSRLYIVAQKAALLTPGLTKIVSTEIFPKNKPPILPACSAIMAGLMGNNFHIFVGTTSDTSLEFWFVLNYPGIQIEKDEEMYAPELTSSGVFQSTDFSVWNQNRIEPLLKEFADMDLSDEMHECLDSINIARDKIWVSIRRFELTRNYIFRDLWVLPSLNKMIEYFPNIKSYLTPETIEKYNKGGAKKKPLYAIPRPNAEVVASTVEATIK